jgi:COX assembly protein 1
MATMNGTAAGGGGGGGRGGEQNQTQQQQSDEVPLPPLPSRNPIPLSASQEAQVRDVFYARVRSKCVDEIKGEFFFSL